MKLSELIKTLSPNIEYTVWVTIYSPPMPIGIHIFGTMDIKKQDIKNYLQHTVVSVDDTWNIIVRSSRIC